MIRTYDVSQFLSAFHDFVESDRKPRTANIYTKRIENFLNSYSVGDLCGSVDRLIQEYSKGGKHYNEADHGNDCCALKALERFLKTELLEGKPIWISYEKGFSSFVPQGEHLAAYTLHGDQLTATYHKGFMPHKTVTVTIPYNALSHLIYLLETAANRNLLTQTESSLFTVHGQQEAYRYTLFGQQGSGSFSLFVNTPEGTKFHQQYQTMIEEFLAPLV